MPIFNWTSQRTEEASFKFAATSLHPEVVIPLFVTEYNAPTRVQRFQDISTLEPFAQGYGTGGTTGFFAAPEPLQTTLAGFVITPRAEVSGVKQWSPTTDGTSTGTSLGLPYVNNAELILAYMEGRMERTSQGAFIRKDPSEFVDPYGNVYTTAYIMVFDASLTVTPKKQTFSMTLWLGA